MGVLVANGCARGMRAGLAWRGAGRNVQELFLCAFYDVTLHSAGFARGVVKVKGALCVDVVVAAVA